jgi:dinuclear metal center YbgI/SA1388 family protein
MGKATAANIARLLNETLRVRKVRDASMNGLQVRQGTAGEIRRVGFAVDACLPTFELARRAGVGLLVVHHGVKWRPQKDRELAESRTVFLRKHNIALYAAHLPLDLHEEYGNNIGLCRILGVRAPRRFGRYHGVKIGYAGTFAAPMRLPDIARRLTRGLGSPCRVFCFGKERIRSLGVVSGGGGSMLKDAREEKLDCFVVGEIDLAVFNAAREYGMNLIVAGHYATETVGVRALMPLVRDACGVETVFLDDPKEL